MASNLSDKEIRDSSGIGIEGNTLTSVTKSNNNVAGCIASNSKDEDDGVTSTTKRLLTLDKTSCATSDSDDESSSSSSEEDPLSHSHDKNKAPNQLMLEFLDAIFEKDWELAEKLCTMILMYEPNNVQAMQFMILIGQKQKIEEENASSSENENNEGGTSDSSNDSSEDDENWETDDDSSSSSSTSGHSSSVPSDLATLANNHDRQPQSHLSNRQGRVIFDNNNNIDDNSQNGSPRDSGISQ